MKNFKLFVKLNIIFSLVFSVFCVSFQFDVSALALPLSLFFSFVLYKTTYIELVGKNSVVHGNTIYRIFQYEPFVFITSFIVQRCGKNDIPFALDLITSLLWVVVAVFSFVLQYYTNAKRLYALSDEWKAFREQNKPPVLHGTKRFFKELLEWLDALIQAVFTIVLLNIFLFQLYEIPSESMVPTFLIKDRVVVVKTLAGPKFPLSRIGLPYFQKYNREDIVVFRNPHYGSDRKNEIKTFWSQFVYMCTLTLAKINKDENGELKADPLVKRIAAVPGEQVYMLDGEFYARTKDSSEFRKISTDSKHAAWDLNSEKKSVKSKIRYIPLDPDHVKERDELEEKRRNLDLKEMKLQFQALYAEFESLVPEKKSSVAANPDFFRKNDLYIYNFYSSFQGNTVRVLSSPEGHEWFRSFLNSWYEDNPEFVENNFAGNDPYEDACFKLNLMAKLVAGRLMVRNLRLLQTNQKGSDPELHSYMNEAQMIADYIFNMDLRNLCLFPANDSEGNPVYIAEDCYFMMGDNRYNSLDMRHSYDARLVPLSKYDSYSMCYLSNLEPQAVHKSRILGKASFRFWPFSRFGRPD